MLCILVYKCKAYTYCTYVKGYTTYTPYTLATYYGVTTNNTYTFMAIWSAIGCSGICRIQSMKLNRQSSTGCEIKWECGSSQCER